MAAAPPTARPPLVRTDEELQQLLGLLKGADSLELKLTIPERAQRSAIVALGMDPLQAEIRQVFFFDTPELTLQEHGVVVRGRRTQRKGDDTVVKLRPVVPGDLPKALRKSRDFVVEVDASPTGFVCSGSFKGVPESATVQAVVAGKRPLRKLFSKDQAAFYLQHAPDGLLLNDLAVLGPIFTLKLRFTPPEFQRKLVAEVWLYPSGARVLELSTKCLPGEAFDVAAQARAFLASKGVELGGKQETKTRIALEFFAKHLDGAAPPPAETPVETG